MTTRTTHRHAPLALALAALLAGCPAAPTVGPTTPAASAKPRPRASGELPGTGLMKPGVGDPGVGPGTGIISRDGAGIISRDGAGIISRDGAGIISRDGAGFTGVATLPAGIISRDGAGIISRDGAGIISRDGAGIISRDGAGYALAALPAAVPVRKQLVYLLNAEGKLVVGADDQPITAETDEQGRFAFKGFVNQKNLLIAIKLYDDKGLLTTVLPRGEAADRQVEVGLASTLTATYIQERFVRTQADPVATLERLPAELEAATRAAVAAAAAKGDAPPADLAPATVLGLVDQLRTTEAAVETQFVEVARVLLAGLSDAGQGQPADTVETDAIDVAVGPGGQLAFASDVTNRVWRKDAQGRLAAIAGNGLAPDPAASADGPAPGDGGPATAAALLPAAIAYQPDGTLLIASNGRIRQVGADGVIGTRAAHADWAELRDVALEPDGGLLVATHSAVWRVPKAGGGAPTRIAGAVRPFEPERWYVTAQSGDGGKPLDAVFRQIMSLARDPRTGEAVVFDAGGIVRRVGETMTRVAGSDMPGYGGDGGEATKAQLGSGGSLAYQPDGTLLIADAVNHRLRAVKDGVITTVAGTGEGTFTGDGGPALAAGLLYPVGVAAAPDGSSYFIDSGYVRRLAGGTVTTVIGGARGLEVPRPATEVQLLGPRDLTYDAEADAMWVTDQRHVWRWTLPDNLIASAFGAGPRGKAFAEGIGAREAALTMPRYTVPMGPGRWATVVTDPTTNTGRIVQVEGDKLTTLAGGAAGIMGGDPDEGPAIGALISGSDCSLAFVDGWMHYTVGQRGLIRRFQPGPGATTARYAGGGQDVDGGVGAIHMKFGRVRALALGPDGHIYMGSHAYVYRIDPKTAIAYYVGGKGAGTKEDGQPITETNLTSIGAFAWDAAGHMYFSEPERGIVRRMRKDTGGIERVAGQGTPNLAGGTVDTGLGAPTGLAFDKRGDLYVADSGAGQIKVVRRAQLGN